MAKTAAQELHRVSVPCHSERVPPKSKHSFGQPATRTGPSALRTCSEQFDHSYSFFSFGIRLTFWISFGIWLQRRPLTRTRISRRRAPESLCRRAAGTAAK